ncbi:hypothetical protein FHX74_003417 [Friedmanniella endophytica]|uniref:Pyridoxal phosphate homeostasis protein n=1 Tax=Microlunatus kandeliicorticis TaxID=1759536 RepID=A0A7W3IV16_9ACTN|nr:YggS family pyridoxal phosphate-dependent enzyme [Microlunatus kandeliicorticis]MBA8795776.1 hypothetical protein [Microlunatus kandeliicorticis]
MTSVETVSGVAANLARVRARIDEACRAAGRDPAAVRLLPVSKTHPTALLREAYAAGVRVLGENKVQEAAAKAAELADLPDLGFAMIGHLQTNKAKDVAAFATEFHALDSVRLAEALDRRLETADRTLDVFVQVNSSGEDTKSGVGPAEVLDLVRAVDQADRLEFRGLMTLAANSDDEDRVRDCFVLMQRLAAEVADAGFAPAGAVELSMGMSGDFELAIAHGATTVRVGQAIFGARPPAA